MIVFTGFIWTVMKGSRPYRQLSERSKIQIQQKTVHPHLHVVRDQQAQILKTKSSSGVLEKSCIICLIKHKKCNQKKQPLIKASTEKIEKRIKTYAQWLQDWEANSTKS